MNKNFAQKLINKTADDYNLIAHHFSSTRKFNWPVLKKLMCEYVPNKKIRVVDLGCGNGRLSELVGNKVDYVGLDISDKLVEIATRKYQDKKFLVGDMTKLPFKDCSADIVISIAALHHIPGKKNRILALSEMHRVLKPGGTLILTNWYFWDQTKYLKSIYQECIKILTFRSNLDFGDFYMPWRSVHKNTLAERYFHAWSKREITKSLKYIGFKNVNNNLGYGKRSDGSKDPNLTTIATK